MEFTEAESNMNDLVSEYQQYQVGGGGGQLGEAHAAGGGVERGGGHASAAEGLVGFSAPPSAATTTRSDDLLSWEVCCRMPAPKNRRTTTMMTTKRDLDLRRHIYDSGSWVRRQCSSLVSVLFPLVGSSWGEIMGDTVTYAPDSKMGMDGPASWPKGAAAKVAPAPAPAPA
jgi:hypothetical protein